MHRDIQSWLDAALEVQHAEQRREDLLQTALAVELPSNLRPAVATDIVEGNLVWYPNDGEPFWALVEKVNHSEDQWKAFTSYDGCRYGLDDAYIEQPDSTANSTDPVFIHSF